MDTELIERIADAVRGARRIAVLSGAGISTASGIPDFRSAGGLYSDSRNVNVFDLAAFQRDPSLFYGFAREFYPRVLSAQPNKAHRVLAEWERRGKEVRIATQNIDDFHQRAGSTNVYPVHGTFATSTCQDCFRQVPSREIEATVRSGGIPHCECGGVYKPDITFFGELLPEEAWTSSVRVISEAELLLVVGTSLLVYPAASLPEYRRTSCGVIVLNRDPTGLDSSADVVCHDELTTILSAVDDAL